MCGCMDVTRGLLIMVLGLVALGCAGPPRRADGLTKADSSVSSSSIGVAPPVVRGAALAVPSSPSPIQRTSVEVPAVPAAEVKNSPAVTASAPSVPAATNSATRLRALHREAAERYAGMDSYIARVRRREQLNGKDRPEELLIFKFRKQPWSVYFKFLGPEGQGRKVIYVKGQHGNLIHTLLAAGDVPLMS